MKDIHRATNAQQKDGCLFLAFADCSDLFCHKHESVPEQHPQSAKGGGNLLHSGSN